VNAVGFCHQTTRWPAAWFVTALAAVNAELNPIGEVNTDQPVTADCSMFFNSILVEVIPVERPLVAGAA
jgi:hypothetical protein